MNPRVVMAIIGLLLAGVFWLDWRTPLGSQEFLLYVLPVLLTAWLDQPKSAYMVAAGATVLVAFGAVLSPPGIPVEVAVLNRSLSTVVFWVTAFLVIRSRTVAQDRHARQVAAIVNSSADAILSQDLEGRVTSWNAAAEAMFGYSAGEMLGRPMDVLFPSERQPAEVAVLARLIHGEPVERYEARWRQRDGRPVQVSVSRSLVRDQAGVTLGISTVAHDIAPLKDA